MVKRISSFNIIRTYITFKKHVLVLLFLHFFSFKIFSLFCSTITTFARTYLGNFSACLIVLDTLSEVFGCSIVADRI